MTEPRKAKTGEPMDEDFGGGPKRRPTPASTPPGCAVESVAPPSAPTQPS